MGVLPVGCEARVWFVIIDDRYIRWRCTDRNCEDARDAKSEGRRAFHMYDIRTGAQWTEEEPDREAEQAA